MVQCHLKLFRMFVTCCNNSPIGPLLQGLITQFMDCVQLADTMKDLPSQWTYTSREQHKKINATNLMELWRISIK